MDTVSSTVPTTSSQLTTTGTTRTGTGYEPAEPTAATLRTPRDAPGAHAGDASPDPTFEETSESDAARGEAILEALTLIEAEEGEGVEKVRRLLWPEEMALLRVHT